MVYIEKFKLKGNNYYRLVHNIRSGDKIIHKTKYLGKEVPPKEKLNKIEQEFLKEINKKGTVIWSRKSNGNGYRAGIQLSGDDTLKPIPLVLRTIYKQRSN